MVTRLLTDKRVIAGLVVIAALVAVAGTAFVLQRDGHEPNGAVLAPTPLPPTAVSQVVPTATTIPLSSPTPVPTVNGDETPEVCLPSNAGPLAKQQAWGLADGLIAFVSVRGDGAHLYTMRPDGSHLTDSGSISVQQGSATGAKWSPDGRQLAFLAPGEAGKTGIHVVNADGSGLTWVTSAQVYGFELSWSPDGRRLAFSYSPVEAEDGAASPAIRPPDIAPDVYIVNLDGSGRVKLTNDPASDMSPAWSPDGKRIAFVSDRDGNREIYVLNSDGSDQIRLTNEPSEDSNPEWSPDGARILFVSNRDVDPQQRAQNPSVYVPEIYVMNADGTGQTNLTRNAAFDSFPAWSPDSSRIAFMSDRDGNGEIYVMNSDGSHLTRVTNYPCLDSGPSWSPDGRTLVFARGFHSPNLDGTSEVFIANADGTGEARLTDNPDEDWLPVWSPGLGP